MPEETVTELAAPEVVEPAPPPPKPPASKAAAKAEAAAVEIARAEADAAKPAPPAPSVEEFEALKAQVAAAEARRAEDAAARATEAAEVTKKLEQQRKAHRDALLDTMKVKPAYRDGFCPADADPFTDEGRAKIEAYYAARPELCDARKAEPFTVKLDDLMKKPGGALIDPAAVKAGARHLEAELAKLGLH